MGWRINRTTLAVIFAIAFLLRAGAVLLAPGHIPAYTLYLQMAQNVAHGAGYCLYPDGTYCAYFPPVYPTLLVIGVLTGHPLLATALIGAAAGAGTCVLIALLGQRLFGERVGLFAAVYAVIYPYYVWHDSVLQETSVLTLLVALTMYALVRARGGTGYALAGLLLGLAVLTKATLLLYAPLAVGWTWRRAGSRNALGVLLGAALIAGPWMIRTWRLTGEPTLYSNTGFAMWTANHRLTFDYFPARSIDDATAAQWADLTPAEREELDHLQDAHDIARSHWLWRKGMEFIRSHPALTIKRAIIKVLAAFSPVFSPSKGWLFESVYLLFYAPLLILAPVGMARTRSQWRDLGYFYLLIAAFAAACGVFWGHTSHRMYLEPYIMLFAAAGLRSGRRVHRNVSGIVCKSAL